MNKKIQLSVLSIFVAAALVGSIVAISGIDNQAFAGEKKKKVNEAEQEIGQSTETLQVSSCDSGNNTEGSCNNAALSFNVNEGNNALGQQ